MRPVSALNFGSWEAGGGYFLLMTCGRKQPRGCRNRGDGEGCQDLGRGETCGHTIARGGGWMRRLLISQHLGLVTPAGENNYRSSVCEYEFMGKSERQRGRRQRFWGCKLVSIRTYHQRVSKMAWRGAAAALATSRRLMSDSPDGKCLGPPPGEGEAPCPCHGIGDAIPR